MPFPAPGGLPGLCSWGWGAGGTEGVGSGHHQHRISFHLCKDSLTPEHINILNDSERSWDCRRPRPLRPPSPPPSPLLTHSSFLLPPLFLVGSLCVSFPLMPVSVAWFLFLCLGISPLSFFPFSVSSPPFLSPSSLPLPRTPQLLYIRELSPGSSGWEVQPGQSLCRSVHPQLGPDVFPGGSQQTLEAEPTQGGPERGG